MANAYGDTGGRTGPYWRRQTGTTLPGERTQQQLNLINMLLQRRGQNPLGGPRSATLPPERGVLPRPGRVALPGGTNRAALLQQAMGQAGLIAQPSASPPHPQFEGGPTPQPGPWHDVVLDDPGAMPADHNINDLRQQLLNRVHQGINTPVGRDSLRQYVQQAQMRRAVAGPQRPIFPPRPGLRTARQRPY